MLYLHPVRPACRKWCSMILHPLGHILTAKYWQNVSDGGSHPPWLTRAGLKQCGENMDRISGASVFVYAKFVLCELLNIISV